MLTKSLDAVGFVGKLAGLGTGLPLGATPSEVIYREQALSLLRYRCEEPAREIPILLIPSMINRHYILDLLPGKSFVEFLVSRGFRVYLIRWEAPEDEDRWLTTERLIESRIHHAVRAVLEDSGASRLHLLGQCLGGTLSTIYAILYPELVSSLSLITAPVDFKNVGLLANWINSPFFDLDALLEAYGNMPWPFMQMAFQMLKPGDAWSKFAQFTRKCADRGFVESFLALEAWSNDNISYPGACYKTVIETFYRGNGLKEGALTIGHRAPRLSDLHVPTLNVFSEEDHIVPPETTLQSAHLEPETELSALRSQGGHIGCLLGSRARREVWPRIGDWIASKELAS